MRRTIKTLFTSSRTTLPLFMLYAALLAAATFIEKAYGTATARLIIYNNIFFFLVQLAMATNVILIAFKQRWLQRRLWGTIVLHLAFIVILLGAFVTYTTGYEGIIHIRENEQSNLLKTTEGTTYQLPFQIKLIDFNITRYPGSNSPSSYESIVEIISSDGSIKKESVYMNKTIQQNGYRIFQTSFDSDEKGTILSVNHDEVGTTISYIGYGLLLASILLLLMQKGSHFRILLQQFNKTKTTHTKLSIVGILFLCSSLNSYAQDFKSNTIPAKQAAEWASVWVQSPNGRMEPMNTYAAKMLRKVYKRSSFKELSAEQVLIGFILNPEFWNNTPLIRQDNKQIGETISNKQKYIRFYDLFDKEGNYVIAQQVERAYTLEPESRTSFDKDILKLDERVNILYAIQNGELMRIFPLYKEDTQKWFSMKDDFSHFEGKDSMFVSNIMSWYAESAATAINTQDWKEPEEILEMIKTYQRKRSTIELPSDEKLQTELLYNRLTPFFNSMIGYAALGFLMLAASISLLLHPDRRIKRIFQLLVWGYLACFLFHSLGIATRWYIANQAPWSNAYESMVYIAWATALAGVFFVKRSPLTLAITGLFAAIILFVATLNWMDPEITPLVPVLKSYWLLLHVAIITASYGFFGVGFLLGILSLAFQCVKKNGKYAGLRQTLGELHLINELSLYIGLFLLTIGIFIGAIWANESWGRYWGWDPKETWALITMIVYTAIIHSRFLPGAKSDYAFSVMAVFGFASVLMTYFGVNYFLTGLHSYASGDVPPAIYLLFVAYAALGGLAFAAKKRNQ